MCSKYIIFTKNNSLSTDLDEYVHNTNFIDEILLGDRTIIFENGEIKKDFLKKDLFENIDFLDTLEYPGIISLLFYLHKSGIDINLTNLKTEELSKKIIQSYK